MCQPVLGVTNTQSRCCAGECVQQIYSSIKVCCVSVKDLLRTGNILDILSVRLHIPARSFDFLSLSACLCTCFCC